MGPGLVDRFQIILHRLKNSPSVNISRIELQEPFELLPTTWQKLFNTLKTCGVSIEQAAIPNNEIQEIKNTGNYENEEAIIEILDIILWH